jgi:Zn finger protein HypA/HybF involved in hydrogenase expression
MHEHSFTEAILNNVKDKENVRGIVLEVGDLVGIEPGHLKEHIEEMYDWDVEVVLKKSKVRCECGFEGEAKVLERLHDLVIFECAKCGGIPEVLEGKDIKILKVVYN